jgi:ribosome-binding protein aMBF1 (putative translation factor)
MDRRRKTTDAIEILDRMLYTDPKRRAEAEQAFVHACFAQEIYRLRTKAGLTQAQLAKRVGTSVSAISRLEDADYDGHSVNVLVRVLAALNHRLQWRAVPLGRRSRTFLQS